MYLITKSIIALIFEIHSYQAPWFGQQDIKGWQYKNSMDDYQSPEVDQQYNSPNFIVL